MSLQRTYQPDPNQQPVNNQREILKRYISKYLADFYIDLQGVNDKEGSVHSTTKSIALLLRICENNHQRIRCIGYVFTAFCYILIVMITSESSNNYSHVGPFLVNYNSLLKDVVL